MVINESWQTFFNKVNSGYNYKEEYINNVHYSDMKDRLQFLKSNKIQPTTHHWNHSLSGDSFLYGMVTELKPKVVVETGVAFGNSSYCILSAMAENGFGKLHSVDIQPGPYTGYLVPEDLRTNWNLILGQSSKKVLPDLSGPIDMFFHDSVHTTSFMLWEYEWAWSKLSKSGVLSSHDVNSGQGLEAFNKFIQNHCCRYWARPKTSNTRQQIGFIYKEA